MFRTGKQELELGKMPRICDVILVSGDFSVEGDWRNVNPPVDFLAGGRQRNLIPLVLV